MQSLQERLANGEVLIADGASGTMLIAAGLPEGTPPDAWNLERPEAVIQLHRAYLEAGSQILLTNTFGANRKKLSKYGLENQLVEINQAAVRLARQAAGERAYVAGDIGPTGELMQPLGMLSFEEAVMIFAEQAAALSQAGVDALWIETMMDLEEARAAVTGARQVSELPLFCTLSFAKKGRTMMGASAKQAVETLWPLGLTAIGANCGDGLPPVEIALQQMRAALPGAPLIAKPNAGLPQVIDGHTVYDVGPAEFATRIEAFVAAGAQIVGACCGSNPEFIAAIRSTVTKE